MGLYIVPPAVFQWGVILAALLACSCNNQPCTNANRSDVVTARTSLHVGQTTPSASEGQQGAVYDGPTPTLNCTECTGRELKRSYRLESIKTDILRKLRLSAPPNTTGRRLPNVPLLNRMITQIGIEEPTEQVCERPQSPVGGSSESDDDRMTTMRVIQFSKPGVFMFVLLGETIGRQTATRINEQKD